MPPNAITFFFVCFAKRLNLLIPKIFLLLLVANNDDKKIKVTPCFSFILISLALCAEPNNKKLFFNFLLLINFLQNEGK